MESEDAFLERYVRAMMFNAEITCAAYAHYFSHRQLDVMLAYYHYNISAIEKKVQDEVEEATDEHFTEVYAPYFEISSLFSGSCGCGSGCGGCGNHCSTP